MNATRLVIATLLAVTAFPLLAAQPQAATADVARGGIAEAEAAVRDLGDAQASSEDRWTVPAAASPDLADLAGPADRAAAAGTTLDSAAKRPALNFADQQPLKPNLFDSPTAWEDEP